MRKKQIKSEQVNHPDHYNQGGIECIDAIEAALTPEEFKGALKFQTMKYTWRMGHKGDALTDAEKVQWYNTRLIEILKKERGKK